jgi:hypothetical protein
MTWAQLPTLFMWTCDLCGAEHLADDDLQPDGWVHDMAGHDRCPKCLTAECGCNDGECRVAS